MNEALLMKWLGCFGEEKEATWQRLIASNYGIRGEGWWSGVPKGAFGCELWKSITSMEDVFKNFVSIKVGYRRSTRFWSDVWCGTTLLKVVFPGIYALALLKNGTMADHLKRSDEVISWDLHLRRPLNDWELSEASSIITILETVEIGGIDEEDRWLWIPNGSGAFSRKSCFSALSPRGAEQTPPKFI